MLLNFYLFHISTLYTFLYIQDTAPPCARLGAPYNGGISLTIKYSKNMEIITWESPLDIVNLFEDIPTLDIVGWDLAADVYKEEGNIVVKMQLPGIETDKYDVSVEDRMLVVKGSRDKETITEDKDYFRKEIQRGNFERRVQLPDEALATDKISISKEDGVLKISIPTK